MSCIRKGAAVGDEQSAVARHMARWFASGRITAPLSDVSVVFLKVLANHVTAQVAVAVGDSLPVRVLITCPIACTSYAKALALEGKWETAIGLFRQGLPPSSLKRYHIESWLDVLAASPLERRPDILYHLYNVCGGLQRPQLYSVTSELLLRNNTLARDLISRLATCEMEENIEKRMQLL